MSVSEGLVACKTQASIATDPAHGRRVVYAPTGKALDLLPAMLDLVRWGAKYDAKSNAPPHMLKGIARDRDAFVAQVRSQHQERSS